MKCYICFIWNINDYLSKVDLCGNRAYCKKQFLQKLQGRNPLFESNIQGVLLYPIFIKNLYSNKVNLKIFPHNCFVFCNLFGHHQKYWKCNVIRLVILHKNFKHCSFCKVFRFIQRNLTVLKFSIIFFLLLLNSWTEIRVWLRVNHNFQ